jgi:hypothetical protein
MIKATYVFDCNSNPCRSPCAKNGIIATISGQFHSLNPVSMPRYDKIHGHSALLHYWDESSQRFVPVNYVHNEITKKWTYNQCEEPF